MAVSKQLLAKIRELENRSNRKTRKNYTLVVDNPISNSPQSIKVAPNHTRESETFSIPISVAEDFVLIDGDVVINGLTTLDSAIISKVPTNDADVVNKKYVDSSIVDMVIGDDLTVTDDLDVGGNLDVGGYARFNPNIHITNGVVGGLTGTYARLGKAPLSTSSVLYLYDVNNINSFFLVSTGSNGTTNFQTNHDGGGESADMSFTADGDYNFNMNTGYMKWHNPNTTRYLQLDVASGGITTFTTNDSIGATAIAHLSFIVDGALIIDTVGKTHIDKDIDNTTAATNDPGLHVDYDRVGAVTSGTDTNTGIDLDVNVTGAGTSGTPIVSATGIDIDVVSDNAGSGTSTATGIDISCTGADKIIQLQLSHDANNHCQFATLADGATTITTTDSDGTSGDLKLAIDGDIELNANGGAITFKDDATQLGAFDSNGNLVILGELALTPSLGEVTTLSTAATTGIATLTTTATTATDADFVLDAGGDITLDSGTGLFVAKNAGTEFSVPKSAYAGMILGYRCLGHDSSRVSFDIPIPAFGTLSPYATVRFIAPPSGVVEVFVQAGLLDAVSGRPILFGLSDAATYNTIGTEHEEWVHTADESDVQIIQNHWVVSGLTAGDTYNYWFGAKTSHLGSVINYGGTGSGHYSPFIMKVTALPTAVANFAVYD